MRALFSIAAGVLLVFTWPALAEEVTEKQKILVLISTVESLQDAVFIKDGAALTCAAAAKWMRDDPELREELPSARFFLSRVSGTEREMPYRIQWKNGNSVLVSVFLGQILERLERIPPGAE